MADYVVCTKCGTRIKAGREFCLKCFEPLPDPDAEVKAPVWESLGLSRNAEIGIAGGAAAAVVILGLFIWLTQPAPVDDEVHPMGGGSFNTEPVVPAGGAATVSEAAVPPLAEAPAAPAAPAEPDPDLETIRASYEERLSNRPNDPDLQVKLGLLLVKMGKPADAMKPLEKAISMAPRNAAYRAHMGDAASAAGQLDRAIDQYREAMRLLPGDYGASYSLAMALQKKGDDATALPEFQRARKFGPKEPGASLGLAVSLEKLGRVDEGLQEYQRFLDMNPNPADAERVRAHVALLTRSKAPVK